MNWAAGATGDGVSVSLPVPKKTLTFQFSPASVAADSSVAESLRLPLTLFQMSVRVRPANRVLDGRGVIPPKVGHNHGPWQSAG
jgi:hypothetical protein